MLVPDLAAPEGERVKLLDFGIAKLDADRDMDTNTRKGEILGTATYMAPEQFQSDSPLDGQCDVYALAVVMYRLVCGTVPFVSTSGEFGLAAMHMFQQHQSLREVAPQTPPWLSDLVDSMLRKDPKQRPTMAEVGEELLAHLSFRPPPRRMSNDQLLPGPALEIIAEHEDSSLFAPTTGPELAPQVSPDKVTRNGQLLIARPRTEWQQRRPRVLAALGALIVLLGVVVWLAARPAKPRLPATNNPNPSVGNQPAKPAESSADAKNGTGPTGSVDPAGQIADPDLEKKGPPGARPDAPGLLKNDAKPPRPRKRFKIIN